MELALAALPGVITSCLLVWLLVARDRAFASEREELRTDVRMAQTELASVVRAHAEQLERVTEAHRKEVANLCQRIQAPQQAVMSHLAQDVPADPPPIDLEDDLALIQQRERELQELSLGTDLEGLM